MKETKFYSRTAFSQDDLETPKYFFDLLNKEFHFTLDPCASPENAKCKKFYTKETNGLTKDWINEIVFINPPFAEKVKWLKKAYKESEKNNAIVVMILPVTAETEYFRKYIWRCYEIRFVQKRVNFIIKCSRCNKRTDKTILYKKTKERFCTECYLKITGNKKAGNGSTFGLMIIIFDKKKRDLNNLKKPNFELFDHR